MRDLNFFLPFTESKKQTEQNNIIVFVIFGILTLFIVGTSSWFGINDVLTNNKIKALNAKINDSALQAKYKQAEVTTKKYDLLNTYNQNLTVISNDMTSKEVASSDLLKKLFSTLPQNVFISSIAVSQGSVQLQASSSTRTGIAEFERNLKALDIVSDVDINGINGDGTKGQISFSVKCTLKGVDKK